MKRAPLIVVLYDGIENSVFDSQVMHPLVAHRTAHPAQDIILVSFEKKLQNSPILQQKIASYSFATFIICKKFPYIGTINLYAAAHTLKKILTNYPHYYLQARGPLAGFICMRAASSACKSLTIQARGLLAQEYAYEHENETRFALRLWHAWRQWQFKMLEFACYTQQKNLCPTTIQTVSSALGTYLITQYNADPKIITLATHDIPATIDAEQLSIWKQQTRAQLNIPANAHVYCYNGSIKPWQCPQETIAYFMHAYEKNADAILYILTQDKTQFEQLITQHNIPHKAYRIITVAHADVYRYLAAADVGLMFRKSHIVNWVSRPTKALEYKAVRLAIEHNHTVAWLQENITH